MNAYCDPYEDTNRLRHPRIPSLEFDCNTKYSIYKATGVNLPFSRCGLMKVSQIS